MWCLLTDVDCLSNFVQFTLYFMYSTEEILCLRAFEILISPQIKISCLTFSSQMYHVPLNRSTTFDSSRNYVIRFIQTTSTHCEVYRLSLRKSNRSKSSLLMFVCIFCILLFSFSFVFFFFCSLVLLFFSLLFLAY